MNGWTVDGRRRRKRLEAGKPHPLHHQPAPLQLQLRLHKTFSTANSIAFKQDYGSNAHSTLTTGSSAFSSTSVLTAFSAFLFFGVAWGVVIDCSISVFSFLLSSTAMLSSRLSSPRGLFFVSSTLRGVAGWALRGVPAGVELLDSTPLALALIFLIRWFTAFAVKPELYVSSRLFWLAPFHSLDYTHRLPEYLRLSGSWLRGTSRLSLLEARVAKKERWPMSALSRSAFFFSEWTTYSRIRLVGPSGQPRHDSFNGRTFNVYLSRCLWTSISLNWISDSLRCWCYTMKMWKCLKRTDNCYNTASLTNLDKQLDMFFIKVEVLVEASLFAYLQAIWDNSINHSSTTLVCRGVALTININQLFLPWWSSYPFLSAHQHQPLPFWHHETNPPPFQSRRQYHLR